jgi:hypothetical protein
MAEQRMERRQVKLPIIGPINRQWVLVGAALIIGIVGYAWWTRTRSTDIEEAVLPEDIPQDREPPATTVVGTEDFTTAEQRAMINTNPEWYTAAIDYLVTTGGFDFAFASITLGKFLARRELTSAEADLVQAAKGAVGDPPQGGPWPILRASAPTATTPGKTTTSWHGKRLAQNTTWSALAHEYAAHPEQVNSVEATRRQMMTRNPTITARIGTGKQAVLKAGWIVLVPLHHAAAA